MAWPLDPDSRLCSWSLWKQQGSCRGGVRLSKACLSVLGSMRSQLAPPQTPGVHMDQSWAYPSPADILVSPSPRSQVPHRLL